MKVGPFSFLSMLGCVLLSVCVALAQEPNSNRPQADPTKKNTRPVEPITEIKPEPFDGASVEKMGQHCVTLQTEVGNIVIEMLPDSAPENARNFLNLVATGAFDTTTFSRVVKDFVIQGGNLSTSEKWGLELAKRMARRVPDEPSLIKHVRGIVSMARTNEPNSATTNFFILVGEGSNLDGTFSAFGRVTSGMDVVDAINHAPTQGEKPTKPVHIKTAVVVPCKEGKPQEAH
ncbi:MAG TPA: peptidylprolyl isomerase [Pyrinomonadaceae bacterium]|nr:peptidylprolyl isomerase [Pyrinomonadaceae bacterium]